MNGPAQGRSSFGPGMPIVVFGDDWGRYVSTMQHLFRHIALDYPVVWVNAIGHRPPTFTLADARRAWEKVRAMARPRGPVVSHGLTGGGVPAAVIEPRGVLPWHHVGPIHAWNTALLVRAIRSRLAALGGDRAPVLVTGSPPSAGVVGQLGEAASVYFCMDDFLNYPGVSARMIAPLERELLQRVDAMVATAESLTKSKVPASGRVHHLPQGVNYEHFSTPRDEPADLRAIPHPRIGYMGRVGGCCDVGLLGRVADAYPDCSIVLVGRVIASDLEMEVLRRPNVHVLGLRPYAELPGYLQHLDVALIPYILNDWTRAVDPLKLLEYLAAGVPVVSTTIPEIVKYRNDVVMAPDDSAFVTAIRGVLDGDRGAAREKGQAVARQHTWKRRADTLLDIIRDLVATR